MEENTSLGKRESIKETQLKFNDPITLTDIGHTFIDLFNNHKQNEFIFKTI